MNETEKQTTEEAPQVKTSDGATTRALSVRLSPQQYRAMRVIAVTRGMRNSEVIAWGMELLERYVQAGGAR